MLAGWQVARASSSGMGSNGGVSRNALSIRVFHAGWAMNFLDCSFGRMCHARSRYLSVAWGRDN